MNAAKGGQRMLVTRDGDWVFTQNNVDFKQFSVRDGALVQDLSDVTGDFRAICD